MYAVHHNKYAVYNVVLPNFRGKESSEILTIVFLSISLKKLKRQKTKQIKSLFFIVKMAVICQISF